MSGFIQGEDRSQATLFPERLDDYVAEDSAVRVIDIFADRQEPAENKSPRLEDKIAALKQEMARLKKVEAMYLQGSPPDTCRAPSMSYSK
jgi:hypothetical protein